MSRYDIVVDVARENVADPYHHQSTPSLIILIFALFTASRGALHKRFADGFEDFEASLAH